MCKINVLEMTSPEIDKRSEKMGLKKHTFLVLGAVFTVILISHKFGRCRQMKYSILKTI